MKHKIIILTIFFIITLSIIFEKSTTNISSTTLNQNEEKIYTNETNKTSGELTNIFDRNNLSGDFDKIFTNNSTVADNNNAQFIPFNVMNDTLINFNYQTKIANGKNYSSNINLEGTSNYDKIQGISTFRGNNYRDTAFYGTLNITDKVLEKKWTNTIGQTDTWTGVGWTGQPAIIKWNDTTKKHMNLFEEFKTKENFIEVIYGTLDSHVHFYDLETGLPSRKSIKLDSSIKGSVTIDPRGYPLLYVGQGINEVSGERVRFGYHIYSLITGEELYFINGLDNFAYLGWGAFDGNPVIDAATDTMILPGENGVIYIAKLNTNYNIETGQISINPEVTRYRYSKNGYTGGTENSMTVYKNYAYFINNQGLIQCLDLNTLTPIWAYPMEDDCDATLCLEEADNNIFLYAACEVDRRKADDLAYIKKLDGRTGKVIWEYSCECKYDANVNGGVLSSPIIGKNAISNLVIFNIAKTTSLTKGKMVALDKVTGKIVWEKDLAYYSWSSPVATYTKDGDCYIVFGDSAGILHLIDGKSGETLFKLQTGGGNIEGSPAVYNNHIVIGTRGKRIYRIDIK